MRRAYITGSAGFIGYHVAALLLERGWRVQGYDGMTDYYDVALKRARHDLLSARDGFSATEAMLEDAARLADDMAAFRPEIVVHLAAQAGVRYSMEAPRSYLSSNIDGTFNVIEAARAAGARHLLIASTSSVYGANDAMPFREIDRADTQMSLYAATKKACESIAHSQAHLHGLPVTLFRFFTVYGPWGRPDMALFLFTRAILEGRPIDVYGDGKMWRDFTYVGDIARGIAALIDVVPERPASRAEIVPGDSLSPVAPCRVVNIGGGTQVALGDYIAALEAALGRRAERNLMPMQPGDVQATWADTDLLHRLTGFRPETGLRDGVQAFVDWYRGFYGV